MHAPLVSAPQHVDELCRRLGLGTPSADPRPVTGGFHHLMWRLDTSSARYTIKQLSPLSDLQAPEVAAHYNNAERVAVRFAREGIPAVCALSLSGDYLQILDGVGYLVYPWREASALELGSVSRPHALQVAAMLARIHDLAIDVPDLEAHSFGSDVQENIHLLVAFARGFHIELADTLQRAEPTFIEIATAQTAAIQQLQQRLVVSHGDLDQKNILWDAQGGAHLIDWESARRLNPTYEVLLQALNWSGITGHFSAPLFGEFVAAYERAGGRIDRERTVPAYQCVLGDWLNWLLYNVGRCLDLHEPQQRATGEKQVALALATLQHIMDRVPQMLGIPDPLAVECP